MSKGNAPKERAKLLVKALLEYQERQGEETIRELVVTWSRKSNQHLEVTEDSPILEIKATKESLFHLVNNYIPSLGLRGDYADKEFEKKKRGLKKVIGEVIVDGLDRHLGILTCDRKQEREQKAVGKWIFTLRLWDKIDIAKNLEELDELWEAKRSPQSAACAANTNITHGTAIGNIENVENLEIHNNTGGSPAPQPERVATPRRENVRLRGFNEIRSVTVWEGREQVLGELKQKLRHGLRVLAITGQGGIGKSSLASKLMEALGIGLQPPSLGADCPYSGVVYFKVQVGTSFDDGAGQLLRDLGEEQGQDLVKPQEKIDKIITYLAGQKWLLVLDNLEDILHPASHEAAGRAVSPEWGQLLNALVYKNHCSQVIITSREMPVDLGELRGKEYRFNRKLVYTRPVDGIDDKAAVKVLEDYEMQDSEADLAWMADRTKGHPLVLELLGNYADQPGYLRQHPELITGEAKPVLQDQLARLDEAGRDLLKRMCVLRVPIDVQGLTFLRLYTEDLDHDYRFEYAAEFEEPAELTPAEIAETREMVERLVASSLVRRSYNAQKQEQVYDLHRVIADFLQEEYAEESPELLKRVYRFYCTGKGIKNPKTLADLQPILEAQHFAFQLGSYDEVYKLFKWNIREFLYTWGHWTLLKELCEKILPHLTDKSDRAFALQQIGCIHRNLGNWNEAERVFNDALALSEEEESRSGRATALGMLGDIARNRGNWDEAERLYHQCLEIETELSDRSGMASTWGLLGDIARNRGNWDEAERLYHQSLELRTELGDRSGMASTSELLGYIANLRGNWDEAETLYQKCLEVRTELGDRYGMTSSWGQLGHIAKKRGNWDEAERLYHQCLEVETELGDRSGMASTWASLGDIARNRGNWDEAERLYHQSLELRTELGDRSGMAATWGVLGDVERMRGNFDAAENYKRQSFQIRQELGDQDGMAMSLCAWGEIKHWRKDFEAAEELYLRSLEIRKALGDKSGVAIVQGCLGANKVSQNKLEEAEELLVEALVTMESLNMSFEIAEAKYAFARLERKRGNLDLAQQHYTTATTIFQNLGAAKDLERIQQEWQTDG